MKATAQYLKKLLESQQRDTRAEKHHLRRFQDLDIESRYQEPEEMPDWAKAIREHNNNIRSV